MASGRTIHRPKGGAAMPDDQSATDLTVPISGRRLALRKLLDYQNQNQAK